MNTFQVIGFFIAAGFLIRVGQWLAEETIRRVTRWFDSGREKGD